MFINTYINTYLTTLLKEEFGMASLEQFKNIMSFVPLLKSPQKLGVYQNNDGSLHAVILYKICYDTPRGREFICKQRQTGINR